MTIAICDADSFYASAQTLFQPWLKGRPVVVASNNDGAIVARSKEAKDLGIKMGQPLFEIMEQVRRGQVELFSSNYELYQSLSNRMMAILAEQAPHARVYSIDESFCSLSGIADAEAWARSTQQIVLKRIGLPIGCGIGPTPTLAKLASWAAKKFKHKTGGVLDITDPVRREKLLKYADVGEVWGIGRRLSAQLGENLGIRTAWQLSQADPKWLRRQFNVNVERTARELTGQPCISILDGGPERKQMIIASRSFGQRLTQLPDLKEAVASFIATAAGKLRAQGSMANSVRVYASTSLFAPGKAYAASRDIALPFATNDTRDLLHAALAGLEDLFRPGYDYAKAGVILSDFQERIGMTPDLFAPAPRANSDALMAVMDAINAKQGRGTIKICRDAAQGPWKMQRKYLSPAYTTDWEQIPSARCG